MSLQFRTARAFVTVLFASIFFGCVPREPLGISDSNEVDSVSPATNIVAPSVADARMDELSAELNQQLEQWPPLTPPVEEGNPIYLTPDESRQRLEKAIVLAKSGDLAGAMSQMSGGNCHPDVGDQWDLLWAELSALTYDLQDATPLAARCAAFARLLSPRAEVSSIRNDLKARRAWAWKFEGQTPAVQLPLPAGENSAGPTSKNLLTVQGYSNQSLPPNLDGLGGSLQHLHFAVFVAANGKYLASYAVNSHDLAGTRVFALRRKGNGRPQVIRVYEQQPSYELAASDVIADLEKNPNEGAN